MGDPRPLTTEEARGLAQRWVAVRLYEIAIQEWRDGDRTERPQPPPFWALDDPERERLFAWVQARMSGRIDVQPHMRGHVREREMLERYIGRLCQLDQDAARALCEAAGWPS